ncbi:polysaccharide deacetylase family protein [Candidatus Foliamicus sp.]
MTTPNNDFRWPGGAGLALSIVLNIEEGAEARPADGDPHPEPVDELGVALRGSRRNLANESNYQYGIKAGAPRLLDLLDHYGAPCTVAAAALALERAPELARRIGQSGHEVCAHGYRWSFQHRLSESEEREFIRKAADSIEQTTGQRPQGWLSRYLFSENTRRLLAEEGFRYHMDDFSADLPWWDTDQKQPMLVLPYALDTNDMKLWNAPAYTPRAWLDYLNDSLDWLLTESRSQARMMSVGIHARIAGRPARAAALDAFLGRALTRPGVWVATRLQIADAWERAHPPPAQ